MKQIEANWAVIDETQQQIRQRMTQNEVNWTKKTKIKAA